MKNFLFLFLVFYTPVVHAQSLNQKIENVYRIFESDPQLRFAISSLTVLNGENGALIFSRNGNLGLASASTLKTITSATAYHLLGKDFTWETTLGYSGSISANGTLIGDIVITGGGDPSLGSDRYDLSRSELLLKKWADELSRAGIKTITGQIIADDRLFGTETMPGGWTWQDMGNYYGAGFSSLTWRENQFDMYFKPGRIGEAAELLRTDPEMSYVKIINEVKTGAAGTGDNVYAYSAPFSTIIYLRGTYGVDLKKTISASVPDPAFDLAYRLNNKLKQSNILVENGVITARAIAASSKPLLPQTKIISVHKSPPLNEIVYWFNRKSINLFGEHLIKTIAWKERKEITIVQGTKLMKEFWNKKIGIDPSSMNIYDGSGLSPANRITTSTMAKILQTLPKESWFDSYYNSLPLYNNIKMKSGSISDVIAYTGYHTSASGTPLVFSFIVNNYDGSSSAVRQKMYRVLNALK
jgi:D-alanyl-D-alanine carboxypeptidase/D-alanyl-D-alanine-endopeptidase (penicillin-binding protein 4)